MTYRRNILFGWTLALLGIALFTRLGFWQLDRMHQKQAMLAAVDTVLAERIPQPLALAADPQQARGYTWAAGHGSFADLPAVLLDNQGRDQRIGIRAYRVFEPDSGTPLLVELGWLPLPGDRTMPAVPRPADTTVSGLLLPPPSAGLARGTPVPIASGESRENLLVIAMDLGLLAKALDLPALAPRVLKLDPAQALAARTPAYARDLDILPNTLPPKRHLGYAVQWFGLAIAVLATALVVTFRKSFRRHD